MAQNTPLQRTVYCGPFVHCVSPSELEICETGAIGVDEHGVINFVEREVDGVRCVVEDVIRRMLWDGCKIVRIQGSGFFFPGFVDTHIHASQYPNAGIFGKSTLLDWLNTYTFPLESSFSELDRARHVYERAIHRTLGNGTTTAAYYATIHVPATNLLADICHARGQRAFIGRVCMNTTLSPDYYRDESTEATISKTKQCISHIQKLDPTHELITPIITPRFAPSCTKDCLAQLGALHRESGYPAQTHLSENSSEIQLVRDLFPEAESYTHVYDAAGLLTEKTVLAHCIHLSAVETALIQRTKAKISHCPASNTALTSGCARVRRYLDLGIDVGLGTDVSGGFSPSILEAARQAIWVSRFVAMLDGDAAKLSVEEVLYLATRGGAKVLGLDGKVGRFEEGLEWDAQLINLVDVPEPPDEDELAKPRPAQVRERERAREELQSTGPVDVFGWETGENRVEKWVYGGNDRNTIAVWCRGRLVHSTNAYKGPDTGPFQY